MCLAVCIQTKKMLSIDLVKDCTRVVSQDGQDMQTQDVTDIVLSRVQGPWSQTLWFLTPWYQE